MAVIASRLPTPVLAGGWHTAGDPSCLCEVKCSAGVHAVTLGDVVM